MKKKTLNKMFALLMAGTMLFGNVPVADLGIEVHAEEVTEAFSVSFVDHYAVVGTPLQPTVTGAADASYEWFVDGVAAGTDSAYTPKEEDLNTWIEVRVTEGEETLSAQMYCSKLPVVYIDTENGQAITSKEEYINANLRVQGNTQYSESGQLYNGLTEIRGRGNSTWSQPKKPYRLKLDKKTDMFGMGKSKHWVLLANYLDESLLRNTLSYNFSGELGMEHLSTVWVDVVMNGEYVGNYQFCENIRVDDDRVEIFDWESYAEDAAKVISKAEEMDDDTSDDLEDYMKEGSMQWITSGSFTFNGKVYELSDFESDLLAMTDEDYGYALTSISQLSELINGGYILELDEYYDEESVFKTDSNQPIMFKNPEFVRTNTDMMNFVQTYVQAFENAVESEDYTALYEGSNVHYSELYDFDELIDYWLVTEIFYNEEINKKSTYMYKDVDEKMLMGPIWDMDWSSGAEGTSAGATDRWATVNFNTNAQKNQWYKYLTQDPYFLMKTQERYWEIRNIQLQDMLDIIDVHIDYLKESGQADYEVWLAKAGRTTSFDYDSNRLQNWINTHVAWIDRQMETEDSFVSGFYAVNDDLELELKDQNGAVLTKDMDENVPADALIGIDEGLTLDISGTGNYAGTAKVFVNGQAAGTVSFNGTAASFEIGADLINEVKDTKNVVEVKVFNSADTVIAENFVTVKETDCVHEYGENWLSDEERHWKECECGDVAGLEKHTFEWVIDQAATPEENGVKHEECTVCHYKRSENTRFEYIVEPADPSDSSKDIPVEDMVAICDSQFQGTGSEGPDDLILDGLANTHWHTNYGQVAEGLELANRWVGVSLYEPAEVYGIRFLPRANGGNGQVTEYEIQYSETEDGEWIKVAGGTWDKEDGSWKYVGFSPVTAKRVRIVGIHTYGTSGEDRHMTCAEFRLVGVASGNSGEGGSEGEDIVYNYIPVSEMTATAGDYEPGDDPSNAIDEDENTIWHTDWKVGTDHKDHWLQLELKGVYEIDGFHYLPRTGSVNGVITEYEIYTSTDGENWTLAAEGRWSKDVEWKHVPFTQVEAKYVKLVTIDALTSSSIRFASAAEVRLSGTKDGEIVTPPSTELSVTINNAYAEVGEELTVTTDSTEPVTYSWTVDGKAAGTEASYKPQAADLEKWIEVTVTNGTATGTAKLYCSKLPVVYIDTENNQPITSKEEYIDAEMKVQGNKEYNDADFLYEGVTEIRGRGNTTWNQPKKPYRLKLDEKANMFDMGKSKHWVLLANYMDESLMRNTLAYNLSGDLGMVQMSTVWVDVILNGQYVGNYQFCENIRTDEHRVEIFDWESYAEDAAKVIYKAESMDDDMSDNLEDYMKEGSMQWITAGTFDFMGVTYDLTKYEDDLLAMTEEDYGYTLESIDQLSELINGGYILELDEYYDEESKFKTDSNQPIMFKNPEFVRTNKDMMNFVQTYVQAFEDAVQSFDYTAEYEGKDVHYSELYDFEELVDYWLVTEIFFNEEINKKSTYMYKDVDELMKMGPIWDMDWSSGGEGDTKHTDKWATLHFSVNAQASNWYKDLVKDPYFLMRVQERYWRIRDEQIQGMLDVMDDHYDYLKESGAADGTVWGKGSNSFNKDYTNLNNWLNAHVSWMDGQMETEDSFDAKFLNKNESLKLVMLDSKENVLAKDTTGKVPADVFAPNADLLLEVSGVEGNGEIFVNGKSYGTVSLTKDTSLVEISAEALDAANGVKNVVEVKVTDASGMTVAANYITVKTDLVKVVDKTLLKEKLEEAKAVDTSLYTEETVKDFTDAMEAAEVVFNEDAATEEDVENAIKDLEKAMDALKVKEEEKPEVCEVFTDIPHGAWYEGYVQYVYDNGLMAGSNGLFNPTKDVTRAQLVTTLYRLAGEPAVTDRKALTDFTDVADGLYYTDAVCWAYNISVGTGNDGKFNPTGNLTRQQMAAFLYRFAGVMGYDTTQREDYSDMINADQVSEYAKEAVSWAVGAGLISGSEVTNADGTVSYDLKPRGNTTRAQLAAILQRFCEANEI